MRKLGTLIVLLLAVPCLAGQKPKDKRLPPAELHGLPISGYGCDKQQVLNMPSNSKETSLWRLIVWAQYSDKHKRYWQQTYGTYEIAVKESVGSSGESAATGAPIGAYENPAYNFSPMDKTCNEWGLQVRSRLKIEPKGDAATKQ